MTEPIKIHPLSAKGRYFVEQEYCLDHELCVDEAPHNFRMDEGEWCAYVFKQPESETEERQCVAAMAVCPVRAIRNDGIDLTPQD